MMIGFAGPSDAGNVVHMGMMSGKAQLEEARRQSELQCRELDDGERAEIARRRAASQDRWREESVEAERRAKASGELSAVLARRRERSRNADDSVGQQRTQEEAPTPVGASVSAATTPATARRRGTSRPRADADVRGSTAPQKSAGPSNELQAALARRRAGMEEADVSNVASPCRRPGQRSAAQGLEPSEAPHAEAAPEVGLAAAGPPPGEEPLASEKRLPPETTTTADGAQPQEQQKEQQQSLPSPRRSLDDDTCPGSKVVEEGLEDELHLTSKAQCCSVQ